MGRSRRGASWLVAARGAWRSQLWPASSASRSSVSALRPRWIVLEGQDCGMARC